MTHVKGKLRDKRGSNTVLLKSTSCADTKEESQFKALYARHSWPLINITTPHNNDVLLGRGGGTNNHPGNKKYRELVEERKLRYVNATRTEKPLIALEIVTWLREKQSPPGRFLQVNESTNMWDDVGYKRAREKASQALREKPCAAIHVVETEANKTKELDSDSPHTVCSSSNSYALKHHTQQLRDLTDSLILCDADDILLPSWPENELSNDSVLMSDSFADSTSKKYQLQFFSADVDAVPLPSSLLPSASDHQRVRSISGNSYQLAELFLAQPSSPTKNTNTNSNMFFNTGNEENKVPQLRLHSRIKRSTSHNAESMKEFKFPRQQGTAHHLERQHSLAANHLPGAVLDLPASPFFDNHQSAFGLSRQLSELSFGLDTKQMSELSFYEKTENVFLKQTCFE
jgi:hypothetical protein